MMATWEPTAFTETRVYFSLLLAASEDEMSPMDVIAGDTDGLKVCANDSDVAISENETGD